MNDQIGTYNHEIGENIVRELTDAEQKILNAERKKAIEKLILIGNRTQFNEYQKS